MRKINKFIGFVLSVATTFSVGISFSKNPAKADAAGQNVNFSLDNLSPIFMVGDSTTATYTVENLEGPYKVEFSTGTQTVATVDRTGKMTMTGAGNTLLTAKLKYAGGSEIKKDTRYRVMPSNTGPINFIDLAANYFQKFNSECCERYEYSVIDTIKEIRSAYNDGKISFALGNNSYPLYCNNIEGGSDLAVGDLIKITGYFSYTNNGFTFENGATYTKNVSNVQYNINYVTNGGSAINPTKCYEDEKICMPNFPTKDSYSFGGWYKDAELTEAWNFNVDTVTSDITIYAKWNDSKEAVVSDFEQTNLKSSLGFNYYESEQNLIVDELNSEICRFDKNEERISFVYTTNVGDTVMKYDCRGLRSSNDAMELRAETTEKPRCAIVSTGKRDSENPERILKGIEITFDETADYKMSTSLYCKNKDYRGLGDLSFSTEKGKLVETITYDSSSDQSNTVYIDLKSEYKAFALTPTEGKISIKTIKVYWFESYGYSNITNLSILFKMDYDFTRFTSIERSGVYVTANTGFTYDNSNPLTALPEGKKLDLVNVNLKNEFIAGVRIGDLEAQYSTQILAVPYIVIDGEYYFAQTKVTSVSEMCNAYKTGDYDELVKTLAEAIENQATANA